MESAGTGFDCTERYGNLFPSHREEVEDPDIVKICNSFSSVDNQIRIKEFRSVVGPGPGSRLIGFGGYFDPLLSFPAEQVYAVESLLVGSASAEDHQLIVFLVIVHGTI